MKVVIIGAGPSALVTCKTLLEAATDDFPFEPIILEQEAQLGGTFRYRSYENATMVSSKQLTAFSDFRISSKEVSYLPLTEYVAYLEQYCSHFNLLKYIRFNSKVTKVNRNSSGGHLVSFFSKNKQGEWEPEEQPILATYLVICAGLHVVPSIPSIPGIENIKKVHPDGRVFHAIEYHGRDQVRGRKVMVLGTGETGMDLAYESIKAGAKEVVLCTRSGFVSIPKTLNNLTIFGFKLGQDEPIALDCLTTNLGETVYVHPWIEKTQLRSLISDFFIKKILWFLTGSQWGCNQWAGHLPENRQDRRHVFVNKSAKAMPYINRPYRRLRPILDWFAYYADAPEDSPPQTNAVIELAPFPTHFLPSGQVVFPPSQTPHGLRMQNRDVRPNTVLYATGFRTSLPFLDSTYPNPKQCDIRDISRTGDEDISFIGFVRPGLGAIPPISEMQAMFWIQLIKGKIQRPLTPGNYKLSFQETARLTYGVDHALYTSTLAKDMGVSPGLWQIYRQFGLRALITYSFGAPFTPFYRLFGPYAIPEAADTVTGELWYAILNRGWLINTFFCFIPMFFYLPLNLLAYVLGGLASAF